MITDTQPRDRAVPASDPVELGTMLRAYWFQVAITLLVVITALVGPSALVSGASGSTATGVRLDVGWGYVALAPLTNVMDALSVLSLGQHYAVLATLILLFVVWRLARVRRPRGIIGRVGTELAVAALSLLGLAAFYGYGMVGPRPMATLVPTDKDVVVVDIHSHTEHSHDSRAGFTAADNRAWHDRAGFHAVYVSDHRTWQGYDDAAPDNPARAGEGTVLLSAIEIKFAGKYASALGDESRYRSAVEGNDLDMDTMYRLYEATGIRPTLVLTIPSSLDSVVASTPDTLGFVAVELSDASPKGLEQSRRDRARLLHMADSLDLALVAASNNHGWGRTAAAWTLMRIPGWRQLTPHQLGHAIERKLHEDRRRASWVAERRVPWAGNDPVALAGTVPSITWNMFGGLSAAERVAWLVWAWVAGLLLTGVRGGSLARGSLARVRLARMRPTRDRSSQSVTLPPPAQSVTLPPPASP